MLADLAGRAEPLHLAARSTAANPSPPPELAFAAGTGRAATPGDGEVRPCRRDVFHAARPRAGDRPVGRRIQGAAVCRAAGGRSPICAAGSAATCCRWRRMVMRRASTAIRSQSASRRQRAVSPDVPSDRSIIAIPLNFDACDFAAWHLDPDRRPDGNRTTSLDWSSPSARVRRTITCRWHQMPRSSSRRPPRCPRAGAIAANWNGSAATDIAGNWSRGTASWPNNRAFVRATVLSIDGSLLRTVVGTPEQPLPFTRQLDRYLFEPDPAVLAPD